MATRKTQQQESVMTHCPVTGQERPYPSHAGQFRSYHGTLAWLFNPWTGQQRDPGDIGTDVHGLLIVPPNEPVRA